MKRRAGNWEYPDNRFNPDHQILGDWTLLEQLISQFVDDMLVTHDPSIDTTRGAFPYEALHRHSDLAGPIVRNPTYAKYIFQLSIWNILNQKYLGHMATGWACEERGTSWTVQTTRGLGLALFRLTCKYHSESSLGKDTGWQHVAVMANQPSFPPQPAKLSTEPLL